MLFTALTAITLMLSETHALMGNEIAGAARWAMLGLMTALILLRPSRLMRLRRPRLFDGFALAFIAIAFASVIYSEVASLTIQRSVSVALLYFAVFWTIWYLADIHGGQPISDLLLRIVGGVFVLGLLNLVVTETAWMKGRFRGILENPNAVGMLTILFMPLAVAYFLRKRNLSSMFLLVAMAGSVALSGSRNGVMTTCLALVFFMYRIRALKTGILLGAIATAVFLAMPDAELDVAGGRAATPLERLVPSDKLATGGGRVEAWQMAIPIIQQKILLGYGFGTEDLIFRGISFRIHRGLYIHNSYLGLTYQVGLLGSVIFFLPLLGLFFVRAVGRKRPTPQVAAYEAVLFGGLIASMFESWVYSAGNAFAFPFWIIVMLLVRATLGAPDTIVRGFPPRPKLVGPMLSPYLARPALPAPAKAVVPRFDPPSREGTA